MTIDNLTDKLKHITSVEYEVDIVIMALLLINYKLIEVVKEEADTEFVVQLIGLVENKLNLDDDYTTDVIDCALSNLTALKTIALYESEPEPEAKTGSNSSEVCRRVAVSQAE